MVAPRARWPEPALFGIVAVAWGLNYLFVRWGLDLVGPLWLAFLRAGVGAVGVGAVLLVTSHEHWLRGRRRLLAVALGLPNTALFFGLWFLAAGQVPPGETAVIVYTYPLWVAVLSSPVLGIRLNAPAVVALPVGFFGVVLLSEPGSSLATALPWPAVIALLGGAVAWAVGTVLMQRLFEPEEMPSANAFQLFGGAAALLVASLLWEGARVPTPSVPLGLDVLWLGVIGTALAYGLWYRLLGTIPAPTLSTYAFVVPVVALAASFVLFGERLDSAQISGALLVLVAIGIAGYGRRGLRVPRPTRVVR